MHLGIDEHHLLTIDRPNIPQHKDYHFLISGYTVKSKDKGLLVYHKRQRKLINLKHLGEGMQVCYVQKKKNADFQLSIPMIAKTLAMFQGFNEETGEKYRFLPFFSKDTKKLQQDLAQKFGIECEIKKEQQGVFIRGLEEGFSLPETDEEILSFLFSLLLIYGKFEEKKGEVVAIKAHIPMFSIWNAMENWLPEYFLHLQQLGVFVNFSVARNQEKATFQFSSNDPELLELFIARDNEKEKNPESLLRLEFFERKQNEIKGQLLEVIASAPELAIDGKEEVLELLRTHRLKFLKYT